MSEMESAYLERDQMQSTSLRDEYLQVIFETCDLVVFQYCQQLFICTFSVLEFQEVEVKF